MEAGFRLHRIGRFSSGEGCAERPGHPRVYLDFPPKDDPALINEYHNRLMQLCGLPFSALAKAVTERTSKGEKRQSQAAGATRSAGEASAVDKPSGPLVEVPVPGLQSDLPASVRRPEPLGNRLRRGSGEMAASSAASQVVRVEQKNAELEALPSIIIILIIIIIIITITSISIIIIAIAIVTVIILILILIIIIINIIIIITSISSCLALSSASAQRKEEIDLIGPGKMVLLPDMTLEDCELLETDEEVPRFIFRKTDHGVRKLVDDEGSDAQTAAPLCEMD
ncbi:hypothetical protein AK812_SmicGene41169 [Symbiodinium microadriaticum]|uniref:Uncharacterized protein n=1 Tax=Symbiodinium microadriaticum TaxID=2951 RepID=A0A1Q9C6S6_SYMMI|nr:hypothetical protein AK812_SmicGene41169 [Symbiodinium microadriaticum]